jgi:glycosyltransferase involved in cell wall biosynthesis
VLILHVIPSLAPRDGGPSKAVIEMCRELRRRSHEAEIYTTNVDGDCCLDMPLGRRVEVGGVDVTYFPVSGGHYYKLSRAMAAALSANVSRYDVVHVHSLYQFPSTAAAHYCRKYDVPYVLRPHGTLDPYLYRRHQLRKRLYELLIERRNLASAAAVQFTTEEELRLAKLSGLRFRGAVVPLGVEIDEPSAGAADAADRIWPELAGKKVLLFLSRINFKKGLDVLAQAFGEIHTARPDAYLVIAGPDTDGYAAQVRTWLAAEGALDATAFTGMVLGERKAALLARADAFVLPSYSENFGISVVEAMGAGLPLLISNRINIWREIDAARAGLIVNPDAGEVAKATLALLEDPIMAKEIGARGRRRAREQFSWRAAGNQLLQLYRKIRTGRLQPLEALASRDGVNSTDTQRSTGV